MKRLVTFFCIIILGLNSYAQKVPFQLNKLEYFERGGVNVMAYQDIYPEGHQGGVAVIMHGKRIATNFRILILAADQLLSDN
ncbi:MAG TPA: hypothetical protein VMW32_10425 [Bacteroidales bacterium]|nr:hypothetical protein [Bacteroidales bacterium]